MIKDLVKLADILDKSGLKKEADEIDFLVQRINKKAGDIAPIAVTPIAGAMPTSIIAATTTGELATVYSAGVIIAPLLIAAGVGTLVYRSWYQNANLLNRMGISENDRLDTAYAKWKISLLTSDMRSSSYFGVSFPKDHPKGIEFANSFDEPFNNGEKINAGYFLLGMQKAGVIQRSTPGTDTIHEFGKAADFYNYSNDIEKFVNTYNCLAVLHKKAFEMRADEKQIRINDSMRESRREDLRKNRLPSSQKVSEPNGGYKTPASSSPSSKDPQEKYRVIDFKDNPSSKDPQEKYRVIDFKD